MKSLVTGLRAYPGKLTFENVLPCCFGSGVTNVSGVQRSVRSLEQLLLLFFSFFVLLHKRAKTIPPPYLLPPPTYPPIPHTPATHPPIRPSLRNPPFNPFVCCMLYSPLTFSLYLPIRPYLTHHQLIPPATREIKTTVACSARGSARDQSSPRAGACRPRETRARSVFCLSGINTYHVSFALTRLLT